MVPVGTIRCSRLVLSDILHENGQDTKNGDKYAQFNLARSGKTGEGLGRPHSQAEVSLVPGSNDLWPLITMKYPGGPKA